MAVAPHAMAPTLTADVTILDESPPVLSIDVVEDWEIRTLFAGSAAPRARSWRRRNPEAPAAASAVAFACAAVADAHRHACEAVMTVEALESGAWLVVVNRSTLDEQPVTAFGQMNRQRLVADKIIWPLKRLAVPVEFVDQWLRNHMPRLLLVTLVPEGREELLEIRRLVLEAWGASDETGPEPLARPEFM